MDKRLLEVGSKGSMVSRSDDPGNDGSRHLLAPAALNDLQSNRNSHQPKGREEEEESNILVAVRVRPMITREVNLGDFDIIRPEDNLIIVMDPVELQHNMQNKQVTDILHRSKEQKYAFDKIFTNESQEQIYNETCKSLIHPVLNGYNACMFAYGTTGAGKTYTMLGYQEVPGIMVLTIKDMFETIKAQYSEREFNIVVSYVEIYNETIRDLLVSSSGYLELRDDPVKGTAISGVTEHKAESTEQIMSLLFMGNKRRTTEATNANQTSSRSHAIFQVNVNSKPKTKNYQVETFSGKLSLIDLAGSERGTVTENRGIRLLEGAKINRSLLALANCINALGDKNKKGSFVPYRDSKLTRLLKDSLGGNSKTVMITNISPASSQIEETLNTLKYASRAKNIKVKVTSNKKMVSLHVAEYKNIINDLRHEIEELKAKLGGGSSLGGYARVFGGPGGAKQLSNNFFNGKDNTIIEEADEQAETKDTKKPGQANGQQQQQPCSCGRVKDDEEMKVIQEELFENFQQRIQIRRALMELDEQNATNILEMRKKRAEILDWEKADTISSQIGLEDVKGKVEQKRALSGLPDHIKRNYENIKTLRTSTYKNISTRNQLNMQLIENIEEAKKIKDSIAKRIQHRDKREYLELVIKNHVLELQNIELEIQLKIQEKTIGDLKNIVEGQQRLLVENNLDQLVNIPWEEAPDLLNANDDGDDQSDDPNAKSLKDYDNEDLKIDDLVYDDEGDQDNESGSFDYDKMDDYNGKREVATKPDERSRNKDGQPQQLGLRNMNANGRERNNMPSIERSEEYLDRGYDRKAKHQPSGSMQNVGSTSNMNPGGVVNTNGNLPNGSSNRRDAQGNPNGGARNSHKSASPAPDKLLRKEGKFKALLSAIKIYGGTKKDKPPMPKKLPS